MIGAGGCVMYLCHTVTPSPNTHIGTHEHAPPRWPPRAVASCAGAPPAPRGQPPPPPPPWRVALSRGLGWGGCVCWGSDTKRQDRAPIIHTHIHTYTNEKHTNHPLNMHLAAPWRGPGRTAPTSPAPPSAPAAASGPAAWLFVSSWLKGRGWGSLVLGCVEKAAPPSTPTRRPKLPAHTHTHTQTQNIHALVMHRLLGPAPAPQLARLGLQRLKPLLGLLGLLGVPPTVCFYRGVCRVVYVVGLILLGVWGWVVLGLSLNPTQTKPSTVHTVQSSPRRRACRGPRHPSPRGRPSWSRPWRSPPPTW